jgi:hypothetical protein
MLTPSLDRFRRRSTQKLLSIDATGRPNHDESPYNVDKCQSALLEH